VAQAVNDKQQMVPMVEAIGLQSGQRAKGMPCEPLARGKHSNTPARSTPGLHRGAFARYSAFNTQISGKLLAA